MPDWDERQPDPYKLEVRKVTIEFAEGECELLNLPLSKSANLQGHLDLVYRVLMDVKDVPRGGQYRRKQERNVKQISKILDEVMHRFCELDPYSVDQLSRTLSPLFRWMLKPQRLSSIQDGASGRGAPTMHYMATESSVADDERAPLELAIRTRRFAFEATFMGLLSHIRLGIGLASRLRPQPGPPGKPKNWWRELALGHLEAIFGMLTQELPTAVPGGRFVTFCDHVFEAMFLHGGGLDDAIEVYLNEEPEPPL